MCPAGTSRPEGTAGWAWRPSGGMAGQRPRTTARYRVHRRGGRVRAVRAWWRVMTEVPHMALVVRGRQLPGRCSIDRSAQGHVSSPMVPMTTAMVQTPRCRRPRIGRPGDRDSGGRVFRCNVTQAGRAANWLPKLKHCQGAQKGHHTRLTVDRRDGVGRLPASQLAKPEGASKPHLPGDEEGTTVARRIDQGRAGTGSSSMQPIGPGIGGHGRARRRRFGPCGRAALCGMASAVGRRPREAWMAGAGRCGPGGAWAWRRLRVPR